MAKLLAKLRPRFSLRTLLIVVTVVALLLGLWIIPSERQRRACDRLKAVGGNWSFDYGFTVPKSHQWWEHYYRPVRAVVIAGYGPTYIDALNALAQLTSVEIATVHVCRLQESDLKSFLSLKNLTELVLSVDDLETNSLEPLTTLTQLETLMLLNTKADKQWDLTHITKFPRLHTLRFTNDAGFPQNFEKVGDLKKLKSLQIRGSDFNDKHFAVLKSLGMLEELNLTDTTVSDAGFASLKNLIKLRSLDLSRSAITNEGLKHIEGLDELRELSLATTAITDEALTIILKFPKLEKLDLSHTKITNAGYARLRDYKNIKFLGD